MAKQANNTQPEDPKAPGENKTPEGSVNYSSDVGNKNNPVAPPKPEDPKAPGENKTPEEKALEFAKPYRDKNGDFWENGLQKFYIVVKGRKQIEKNGKLVFEDTGLECPYYENLLPLEVKRRKEKGEIF